MVSTRDMGPAWNYQGTAFNLSFVFWCVAAVMISVVMLRSASFGKITGCFGIVGNVAALGLFLPVIGVVLSLVSLAVLPVWYLLIARGLFQLSRSPEALAGIHEAHA